VPTRPPGRSNRGQDRAFASPLAPTCYKSGGRGRNPSFPSHQPHWGFRFLLLLCVCRESRGAGAPPPCRTEEEQVGRRAAAGAVLLGIARGREGLDQSPQGKKEPFASGKEPDWSRDQGAVVNAYATRNAYTASPSTPSRPRLHRRPDVSASSILFTSSPPWFLRCVLPAALGCTAV
jgi:hypothetical protein